MVPVTLRSQADLDFPPVFLPTGRMILAKALHFSALAGIMPTAATHKPQNLGSLAQLPFTYVGIPPQCSWLEHSFPPHLIWGPSRHPSCGPTVL